MQKTKQNKLKKTMLTVILGTTLLTGGLVQTAEASPLWFTNYLQGKTTSVVETKETEQANPTRPEEVESSDGNSSQTEEVATPSTGGSTSDTQRWYSDSYWRNRTYTPSTTTQTGGSTWTRQPAEEQEPVTKTPVVDTELTGVAKEEQILLQLLNQERKKRGLNELVSNPELTRLARMKAKDMADLNYFSHTSPTYGKAVDMVRGAGVDHWIVGENIAITTSGSRANELFMGSTTHRSTMLNRRYTEVGIGMYRKPNGSLYVAEIFIGTR